MLFIQILHLLFFHQISLPPVVTLSKVVNLKKSLFLSVLNNSKWKDLLGMWRGKHNKDMVVDYYELLVCVMLNVFISVFQSCWGFIFYLHIVIQTYQSAFQKSEINTLESAELTHCSAGIAPPLLKTMKCWKIFFFNLFMYSFIKHFRQSWIDQ